MGPKLSSAMRKRLAGLSVAALAAALVQFAGGSPAHAGGACPASAPEAAVAVSAAKACHGPVEALDRRTPSSRTFAQANGTATVETYAAPRWVPDGKGAWTDLDTTLRFDGDAVVAGSTLLPVKFSGGGTGTLATLSDSGRQVTMNWTGHTLPKPTLSGSTATYAEVLPGIDLQLQALAEGYTEVLVVKTPAAARQAALAKLQFKLGGTGVSLLTAADGGVDAVDPSGKKVFSSPHATMWDSTGAHAQGGSAKRVRAMGQQLAGTDVQLTPDADFLADAATQYPVYIDPPFTGNKSGGAWAVIADRTDLKNSTFWQSTFMSNSTTYGNAGAGMTCDNFSGNTCNSATYHVRTLLRMELPASPGQIISATFSIPQRWAWTCNPGSNAQIFMSNGFSNNVTWNNQPNIDTGYSSTAAANNAYGHPSSCGDAANVDFDATSIVRHVAGATDVSLSLRSANEGSQLAWKRFDSGSAQMHVEYNHLPDAPGLSQLKMGPDQLITCGQTAATATHIGTSNGLTLNAVLTDGDAGNGQLLRATWEVTGIAAQYAPAAETAGLASGANHSTTIPAAAFTNGAAISWRVEATDNEQYGNGTGDWSPSCYLVVDNLALSKPTLTSTDLKLSGGIPLPPLSTSVVGRSATVTFTPAAGEAASVVGYKWALAADSDAQPNPGGAWVQARTDGTAVAAVVPLAAVSFNSIVVAAVKADGSLGTTSSARFKANAAGTFVKTAGDATGDGRADLTVLGDVGNNKSTLWRYDATGSGATTPLAPPVAPQGNTGIFATGTKYVTGDFDGDGLSDVATLTQAGNNTTLAVQRSVGGNQMVSSQVLDTQIGWQLANTKMYVGDFNGDGKDDVYYMVKPGATGWSGWLSLSTGTPGTPSFGAPFPFGGGAFNFDQVVLAVGDYDGDHRADLYEINDGNGCLTEMRFHHTTTAAQPSSDNGIVRWSSGAANLCWGYLKFFAGDFNGDGLSDVAATYDRGTCQTQIWVWTSTSTSSLAAPVTQWDSGQNAWCQANLTPVPGDYNGDGKTDIGLYYRCCGAYQAQAWVASSTGTAFTVTEGTNGGIGPVGAGSVNLDTVLGASQQKYQVLNPNSNTCSDGTTGPLLGQPCAANPKQYVTFERRGAQYVSIHPVDPANTCYDITWGSANNGTPMGVNACHGVATQLYMLAEYYTVEYVGGPPSAPMVRFITPLSGKCMDLNFASSTPGTAIQEYDCNGSAAQQWILKPVA